MKTKLILSLSIAVLLSTAGVFANHSEILGNLFRATSIVQAENSNSDSTLKNGPVENIIQNEVPNSGKPVSDEIAFDMFFIEVISMDRAADTAEAKGRIGNIWRNYLQRQGFTDSEAALIRQVAKEHAALIAPIHARATQIIRNGRAALAEGRPLPPPPPELAKLQQQRSDIAARSKNKLQNLLGAETVQKIRQLMQLNGNNIQIDPTELMSKERRRELFEQKNRAEVKRND